MSNICGETVSKSRVKFRTFYLDFRYFGTIFRHLKNIQWLKITFKTKSKKIHVEFDAKNGILGLNRAKIVKITDFSKILNNQAKWTIVDLWKSETDAKTAGNTLYRGFKSVNSLRILPTSSKNPINGQNLTRDLETVSPRIFDI